MQKQGCGQIGPLMSTWGGIFFHHNFSVNQSPIWINFFLERALLVIFEEGGRLWGHWESVSVGWLWPLSSEQQNFSSSQIIRSFANAASRYFRKDIESLSVGWVPPFICAVKLSPQSKPSHSPTLPTLTSTPSSSLGTWENLIIRSFLPISSSSSHWQLLNQVCRGQLILCRGSVYDTTRPKMWIIIVYCHQKGKIVQLSPKLNHLPTALFNRRASSKSLWESNKISLVQYSTRLIFSQYPQLHQSIFRQFQF